MERRRDCRLSAGRGVRGSGGGTRLRWSLGALVASALVLVLPIAASGVRAEVVTLVAVSAADGEAVLRVDGAAPAVRKVGDEFADGRFALRKVLADRVVLEERPTDGRPVAEVWVYLADEEGHSRVRRIERTIQEAPPPEFLVPVVPGAEARE